MGARSVLSAFLALSLLLGAPLCFSQNITAERAEILAVRVGEWADRSRFVIDTDNWVGVEHNSDSEQNEFSLTFRGIGSDALAWELRDILDSHSLIKGYHFSGKRLTTELKINLSEPSFLDTFELSADNDHAAHRVVIDLLPRSKRYARIIDARTGHWRDRERLVLETDRKVPFELLTDAKGRSFDLLLTGVEAKEVGIAIENAVHDIDSPIKHVDTTITSDREPGSVRLGISLNQTANIRVFDIEPDGQSQHRLVVDLITQVEKGVPRVRVTADKEPVEAPRPTTKSYPEEIWLDATLNQQRPAKTILALRDKANELLVSSGALRDWGVVIDRGITSYSHYGEQFFRLSDLGIKAETDMTTLTAELTASPELLSGSRLSVGSGNVTRLDASPLGGFLNYDISATHTQLDQDSTAGGFFELGAFNGWGSGTTSTIVRDQSQTESHEVVRLDSTWRKDDPADMQTLTVGDTVTEGTSWSGAARFGGIQWGTNFSTRPEYITSPLLSFSDEAALPSTVDVYVDDVLKFRDEIPSGPFTIDQIPSVTGSGQAKLVIRDILGRERAVTQSFYSSSQLLRPGLNEYSIDLGVLRENYGQVSNDYGDPVASLTWRGGISNYLTLEGHAQATKAEDQSVQYMSGLGASVVLPFGGIVNGAIAGSQNDLGAGSYATVGLQRQGEWASFGFTSDYATEAFRRIGINDSSLQPKQRLNAYMGMSPGQIGSFTVGYTEQTYWNRDTVKFGTANYSLGLGDFGQLSMSALHFIDDKNTILRATYSVPLSSAGVAATASASKSDSENQGSLHLQKSLPAGEGVGYGLAARTGDSEQYDASIAYQNNVATLKLEGAYREGSAAVRGNASGGFAILGGSIHPSRRIDSSFGVVRLDGFEDVRVYAENLEIGRTNQDGYALVPRLRPYEENHISIELADLPLDARISHLDTEVSPYYRSGIFIEFPVSRSRDAFFRVIDEQGSPLPLGTSIRTEDGTLFPVGYRGEVFLTELESFNQLEAIQRDGTCSFALPVPDSTEPLLDLGTVTCRSQ